jgi:hypothetical protein
MTGSPAELRARKAALEDLITLRGSVEDAVKQLRAFDWDTAPDLVTLTPGTVIDVLNRYLQDASRLTRSRDGPTVSRFARTLPSRHCSRRS